MKAISLAGMPLAISVALMQRLALLTGAPWSLAQRAR